jgi:hypothetical protein
MTDWKDADLERMARRMHEERGLDRITSPATAPGPVRTLECCCCGSSTKGRQWWNRDTGYGLCVACIPFVSTRWGKPVDPEEIRDCYGVRGVHYDLPEGS